MDIEIKILDGVKIEAKLGTQVIKSDQSKHDGGEGTAPNPFEYFLASVGLCQAHYINAFCKERQIPTDKITIMERVSRNETKQVVFTLELGLPADFPEKYKDALVNATGGCAVKKAIQAEPIFELKLV